MPRLIDADNLVEVLDEELEDRVKGETIYTNALKSIFLVGFAKQVINDAPTVDAEPVVRCKDCKWYEIEQLKRDGTDDKRYKPSVCVIGKYAKPRKEDWYCADGERKEDELLVTDKD